MMASDQQKREQEIERLAREIGRLIRETDPESQEELREAATDVPGASFLGFGVRSAGALPMGPCARVG